MIGQTKLLNKLNTYNIDNFPRSVILLGETGMGKHTIANHLSKNVIKLPLVDITQTISDEFIDKIYRNPNPMIYLIDMSMMTEKEQNILLKFVEEPLINSFIILLCESRNAVLNTILNRCIIFELDNYTKEELSQFVSNTANKDLILQIVRTPGKLKSLQLDNISELYDLCNNIASRLNVASYANTLTILNKINLKDEYDKFDLNLFFDVLVYVLFNGYVNSRNDKLYRMYLYTIESRKKLVDKRITKELFMTNFLTNLWEVAR